MACGHPRTCIIHAYIHEHSTHTVLFFLRLRHVILIPEAETNRLWIPSQLWLYNKTLSHQPGLQSSWDPAGRKERKEVKCCLVLRLDLSLVVNRREERGGTSDRLCQRPSDIINYEKMSDKSKLRVKSAASCVDNMWEVVVFLDS